MEFRVIDLGLVNFQRAWNFQKELFNEVRENYLKAALIVSQHYPVITLGRLAKKENILTPEDELRKRGIYIYEIERGGDVTYHGPGQIIAYPIFNLNYLKKDIHLFLRQLEKTVIDFLADFGIQGARYAGLTGVWIGKQKISSMGIAIKNWITFHGVSINIKKNDLDNFRLIKPCGIEIEMTALETMLGRDININSAKGILINKFKNTFSNYN